MFFSFLIIIFSIKSIKLEIFDIGVKVCLYLNITTLLKAICESYRQLVLMN